MKECLIELLLRYGNRIYDENFINEVVDIFCEYYGIQDYVKSIKMVKGNKQYLGCYYGYNKSMLFALDSIDADLGKKKYISNFHRNLEMLHIIIHECEHAFQTYQMEYEESFEADLCRLALLYDQANTLEYYHKKKLAMLLNLKDYLSCKSVIGNRSEVYKRIPFNAPEERMAELDSYGEVFNVLSGLDVDSRILTKFIKDYNRTLYSGYSSIDGSSPTLSYLTKIWGSEFLSQYDWYNKTKAKALKICRTKFTSDERVRYGLPLSKEEVVKKEKRIELVR